MQGYVVPLSIEEAKNPVNMGYDFIRSNPSRKIPFSYEESSIDLAVVTTPRIIVDDVVYEIVRQYFNKISSSDTERIMVLSPIMTVAENPGFFDKETGGLISSDKPATGGGSSSSGGGGLTNADGTLTEVAKKEIKTATSEVINEVMSEKGIPSVQII